MKTLEELGISPSPWRLGEIGRFHKIAHIVEDEKGKQLTVRAIGEANASLIAAAPDLYEALRKLVAACGEVGYKDGGTAACYESEHHLYDALWEAKSALAKASGESEAK